MGKGKTNLVKLMVNSLYDVQKVRMQIDARIDAFLRDGGAEETVMAERLRSRLSEWAHQMEDGISKDVEGAVSALPVIKWFEKVKGIGPRLSGSLVGLLIDVSNYETVSAMWGMCGQGVLTVCETCNKIRFSDQQIETKHRFLNRQAERRWELHCIKEGLDAATDDSEIFVREAYTTSEEKLCRCEEPVIISVAPHRRYFSGLLLNYNPFLKTTCWKLSGQFVKQGKFYRTVYEQYKEYYTARDGDTLTKKHIDNRARRAMVKLFLSHLWYMWRKSEGLEVGESYLQFKLGDDYEKHHQFIYPPYHTMFDE